MSPSRLEAFTDGVVAIVITIMVLDLRVPQGTDRAALLPALPVFVAYVFSYVNVGIFWSNHHHMLHVTEHVDGRVLWANLSLLFWISLIPFVIRWMDETHFAALPMAAYGIVLGMAAVSYTLLEKAIILVNGPKSRLALAVGRDWKGKASIALYFLAVPVAYLSRWAALAIYVGISLAWLVPDRRIESRLER
jgi:uncharacterized membrane protein